MSFRYPLDKFTLTQGFGGNAEFYKQYGQKGHNGLDLAVPAGTPVYAADEGTVVFEGWGKSGASGYAGWMGAPAGICIVINHIGSYGGYAHLMNTVVNNGQVVKKGQLIGHVGATGAATGSHLHFEMLPLQPNFSNGYAGRINPMPYMDSVKTATEAQIKQAYLEILERPADAGGITHYREYTIEFVRQDLANSQEKRNLDAAKAAHAKAAADAKAAQAKKEADKKKAEEAAKAAQAEIDRIKAEEKAAEEAAKDKVAQYEQIIRDNNAMLKQILSVVQEILAKLTSIFRS